MGYEANAGECGRCRHFSIKGDIGDGTPGQGRCDNPRVYEQVRVTGTQFVRFAMERLGEPESEIEDAP